MRAYVRTLVLRRIPRACLEAEGLTRVGFQKNSFSKQNVESRGDYLVNLADLFTLRYGFVSTWFVEAHKHSSLSRPLAQETGIKYRLSPSAAIIDATQLRSESTTQEDSCAMGGMRRAPRSAVHGPNSAAECRIFGLNPKPLNPKQK